MALQKATLININSTMSLADKTKQVVEILKKYPKTFLGITVFGVSILALRKLHHRFIMFPQVGGRYNNTNTFEYQHPRNKGLQSIDLQILTEDNITLRGWYIKHPNPEKIIVYYHQNAGNIGGRLFFIDTLMKKINTSVIIVAYRGFSESDGKNPPNETKFKLDSKAILKKSVEIAAELKLPLFVYGRSLGGAASLIALSMPQFNKSVKGLILQNTFTSIYDVAQNILPRSLAIFKLLLWLITFDSFRSIDRIKDINSSVLFIKGCKDEMIPKKQMDDLQNACVKFKKEHFSYDVIDGTHNDTWYKGGQEYWRALNEFLVHCTRL